MRIDDEQRARFVRALSRYIFPSSMIAANRECADSDK